MSKLSMKHFKIDHLGYLFCGDCIGFGTDGPDCRLIKGRPEEYLCTITPPKCDGCWKTEENWPTAEEVSA